MSGNDLILIRQLISQRRDEIAPELSDSEYFEIFAAEQALKDRDLSYDEIQDGIVDGRGDGGIDAFYFFINNTLCRETIDSYEYKRNVPIELVFVQAKTSSGFSEAGMDKYIASSRDLLDLTKEVSGLATVYNNELLEKIIIFRECYTNLISKFPKLTIRYFYAVYAEEVHPNVQRKIDHLQEIVESAFSPVEFSFDFLTASKLLQLARRTPKSVHHLKLAETPISTGQIAYVCLARLNDYVQFISENGTINERIFEGNVRDYQGNTEVNQKIRETLTNASFEDFWWLNNGITIICTDATVSGKTLTIENAEVVNGLQTSREMFEALSSRPQPDEPRSVLVRVIVTKDAESRDRIIRATNSQTTIPSASLRATDKIHRDIEDFLAARGLFYDRRKNFYKNSGKPVRKIISIGFLAQAVLACALGDPANARARPSSVIKRDEDYRMIFNDSYPLDVYYNASVLTMNVEDTLRRDDCIVPSSHWNNVRFYVAMLAAMKLMDYSFPSAKKMAKIDLGKITTDLLMDCIAITWKAYLDLGATDQVAKGTVLKSKVIEAAGFKRKRTLP
ncbi:AIPR family protein [Desulfatiglans anilini]|uniref:AIPR family protein n=1 Tax=Desulfatiglans anilini TaxID=90728 RepID=UPI0004059881|nr:AIPR family protein [Desulfatiglans anilini]